MFEDQSPLIIAELCSQYDLLFVSGCYKSRLLRYGMIGHEIRGIPANWEIDDGLLPIPGNPCIFSTASLSSMCVLVYGSVPRVAPKAMPARPARMHCVERRRIYQFICG